MFRLFLSILICGCVAQSTEAYDDALKSIISTTNTAKIRMSVPRTRYHWGDTLGAEITIVCLKDNGILVPDPEVYAIEISAFSRGCANATRFRRYLGLDVGVSGGGAIDAQCKLIKLTKNMEAKYFCKEPLEAPEFADSSYDCSMMARVRYTPWTPGLNILFSDDSWVGPSSPLEVMIIEMKTEVVELEGISLSLTEE